MSLEGVILAGAVAAEARAAAALAAAGGGEALIAALRARQADDEHVLQTVYAFRQLLAHAPSAEHLVSRTGTGFLLFLTRFQGSIIIIDPLCVPIGTGSLSRKALIALNNT